MEYRRPIKQHCEPVGLREIKQDRGLPSIQCMQQSVLSLHQLHGHIQERYERLGETIMKEATKVWSMVMATVNTRYCRAYTVDQGEKLRRNNDNNINGRILSWIRFNLNEGRHRPGNGSWSATR